MKPAPHVLPPAFARSEPATAAEGLVDSIERASLIVEAETAELRRNGLIDYAAHRRDKDLCLLELTRRSRALDGLDPGNDARKSLRRLRDAIIDNQAALRVHLAAARQVANILIDVMVQAESDRTYNRSAGRRNRPA